jgi:CDP-diacylglycerol---glycerol-3-phosphate 3-phosphatidyltransferase
VRTEAQSNAVRLARLTSARIVLVPIVMALVLWPGGGQTLRIWAAAIFTVAALTDFLDGYLARRWKATTRFGTFLDTTADKLLVTGVLCALVWVHRASPWVALIIIGREILILGLRGVVAADGTVVRPSIWGKLKFNVQFVAILLAILRLGPRLGPWYLDQYVMLAAAIVTLVSGIEYVVRYSSAFAEPPART